MLQHVISRGNAGEAMFRDDRDYARYVELMGDAARRFGVVCESYCLMPTHVHLVLRPGLITLSRMMQQLNSRYCQWFNRRHHRFGHLTGGRFKAPFVDTDLYFMRLIRYVLRNPVAAGLAANAADWPWSSYAALRDGVDRNQLVSIERVWLALGTRSPEAAERQLSAFLADSTDDEFPDDGYLIGSEAFARRFGDALRPARRCEDYVRSERFASRPPLDEVLPADQSKHECGVKQAFFEWAYTLREIGRHLGRTTATIWRWVHRRRSKPRAVGQIEAGPPDLTANSTRPSPQGLVAPRLETVTATLEGYCFEWCTRFCAGTPCDSS
jgi:REP element-mobilizing transposase RayT